MESDWVIDFYHALADKIRERFWWIGASVTDEHGYLCVDVCVFDRHDATSHNHHQIAFIDGVLQMVRYHFGAVGHTPIRYRTLVQSYELADPNSDLEPLLSDLNNLYRGWGPG